MSKGQGLEPEGQMRAGGAWVWERVSPARLTSGGEISALTRFERGRRAELVEEPKGVQGPVGRSRRSCAVSVRVFGEAGVRSWRGEESGPALPTPGSHAVRGHVQ